MKRCAFLTGILAVSLMGAMSASATLLVANGTYVFTETDGHNYCTGSTVTFLNDTLVAWNIIDTATESNPYTEANSTYTGTSLYEALVYGANDWAYNIQALNHDPYGDPLVEIGDSGGAGAIYDNPSYGDPLDPLGTWTVEVVSEPAPVPEPTTLVAGALLLLPFGVGAIRSLRKERTA